MIEITKQMLDKKMKQANGSAVFVEDKIAQALLDLELKEFRKLPGRAQTWAGLYATTQPKGRVKL